MRQDDIIGVAFGQGNIPNLRSVGLEPCMVGLFGRIPPDGLKLQILGDVCSHMKFVFGVDMFPHHIGWYTFLEGE